MRSSALAVGATARQVSSGNDDLSQRTQSQAAAKFASGSGEQRIWMTAILELLSMLKLRREHTLTC